MRKKSKRVAGKNEEVKVPLVEKFTDSLDIPKETVYDMPYITMMGNKEVQIENFLSIVAYGEHAISLKTQCGVLSIEGDGLEAKHMDSESILIRGAIKNIGFTR